MQIEAVSDMEQIGWLIDVFLHLDAHLDRWVVLSPVWRYAMLLTVPASALVACASFR